jgi:Flp pilus assembly protein TadD
LEKNPNNADAYYEIGVIYEEQGQDAAARAEWRKALRVQVNHSGALQKLAGSR